MHCCPRLALLSHLLTYQSSFRCKEKEGEFGKIYMNNFPNSQQDSIVISNITKREKVAKVSYKEQDGKSMMTFIPKTFFLRALFFFSLSRFLWERNLQTKIFYSSNFGKLIVYLHLPLSISPLHWVKVFLKNVYYEYLINP